MEITNGRNMNDPDRTVREVLCMIDRLDPARRRLVVGIVGPLGVPTH